MIITTMFDIGQTVTAGGDLGIVKSISIGSDGTPYYLIEFKVPPDGDSDTVTYRQATLPESALGA